MNHRIIWAAALRRDELLLEAARARLGRQALGGRPDVLRGLVADSALALSSLLANFAQAMRA